MTVALNISFEDLAIRQAADGLIALDRNLRGELLAPIGSALEFSTVERFDTNVGPDGQAWAPSYRALLQGGRTLANRGHLRDSIHFVLEDEAVEIGTADMRAGVHQFGATITAKSGGGLSFRLADGAHRVVQSVTIPARPFLGLSATDRGVVVQLAEDALAKAVQP